VVAELVEPQEFSFMVMHFMSTLNDPHAPPLLVGRHGRSVDLFLSCLDLAESFSIQASRGKFTLDDADKLVAWAVSNGKMIRGTALGEDYSDLESTY